MNGSPIVTDKAASHSVAFNDFVQGLFDPQPDITAYEVAILLPMILHGMTREGYDSLGAMQRHIRLAS